MRTSVGSFEIPARDLERAAEFYRRAFGWEVRRVDGPGAAYFALGPPREIAAPRVLRGGLGAPETVGAAQPLLVLHVEDGTLEESLERVVAAGGSIVEGPRPVESFGHFARVCDSEGNLLGIWRAAT